jgi:hypothetical protein
MKRIRHPSKNAQWRFCLIAGTLALICAITCGVFPPGALAQGPVIGATSAPVIGGTYGMPPPPPNPFSTITGSKGQKTASGQPCIHVAGAARPQIIDPHIYDHLVFITNDCGVTIRVQVCYLQSSSCIKVIVKGYEKTLKTLGIAPGIKDFRYESRELL